MRKRFRCCRSHEWEVSLTAGQQPSPAAIICPVCGNAAESLPNGTAPRARVPLPGVPAIPGYDILEELGRGGMGVVYKARQESLNRLVAVKMIRADLHVGRQEWTRFRLEAEFVARLRHANIVQIHEVGEWQGQPYIILEYVAGGSLARQLRGEPQQAGLSARLIEALARAIHHAHQQGVIHRDLKPANILLPDGAADQPGQAPVLAKITDFGLAKSCRAPEESGHPTAPSHPGAILGTPSYMAPEQAEGRDDQVGAATDVYALGAVLYEMLTGRPPFRGTTLLETLEQVRSQNPVPPRHLRSGVPRDLETICLKCLEKAPRNRYASAEDLADDLARFLEGRAIHARPVGAWGKAAKWARRHPTAALLLAACALALLALSLGAWWHVLALEAVNADLRASGERERWQGDEARARRFEVEERERQLAQQLYAVRMHAAARAYDAQRSWEAVPLLEALQPKPGQPDLRGLEWHYLWQHCRTPRSGLAHRTEGITALALSPDGKTLAVGSRDGVVYLWDLPASRLQAVCRGRQGGASIRELAFSPDSRVLASSAAGSGPGGELRLWNVADGTERRRLEQPEYRPGLLAFSPDGRSLAVVEDRQAGPARVRLCDLTVPGAEVLLPLEAPQHGTAITFSPNGLLLALSQSQPNTIQLWDLSARRLKVKLVEGRHSDDVVNSLAFSPDGKTLASVTNPNHLTLWDVPSGKERTTIRGRRDFLMGCRFRADGSLVLGAAIERQHFLEPLDVTVHDGRTARQLACLALPGEIIRGFALSPDGRSVLLTCLNHRVRVVAIDSLRERSATAQHRHKIWAVAWSPDGSALASASGDCTVGLWDAADLRPLHRLTGHWQGVSAVAFSPDARLLASGGDDWTVRLWDVQTGAPRGLLSAGFQGKVQAVAFSPDGKTLAAGASNRQVLLWRLDQEGAKKGPVCCPGHTDWVRAVAFSPAGKLLATSSDDGKIRLWDLGPWQEGAPPRPLRDLVDADFARALAFAPDGLTLASGHDSGWVKLWRVATGERLTPLVGHEAKVRAVAFAPDGRTVASGGNDATVRIWDVGTGLLMATLREDNDEVTSVAFSPDGQALTAGCYDGRLRVWRVEAGR